MFPPWLVSLPDLPIPKTFQPEPRIPDYEFLLYIKFFQLRSNGFGDQGAQGVEKTGIIGSCFGEASILFFQLESAL